MESSVVAPPSSLPSLTNAANSGAMSCWALKRKAFLLFCSRRPAAILSITRQAAQRSPLQVGIACDRERLIVHYKIYPHQLRCFR